MNVAHGTEVMFDPSKPFDHCPTPPPARRVKLIDAAGGDILGLRIGIKTAGCSGLQYDVSTRPRPASFEDKVEEKGVTLFIDPSAVMFSSGRNGLGRDEVRIALVFNNPIEAARCGCGESFTVTRTDTERYVRQGLSVRPDAAGPCHGKISRSNKTFAAWRRRRLRFRGDWLFEADRREALKGACRRARSQTS